MKITQVKSFYIAGKAVKKLYCSGKVIWEKSDDSTVDAVHQLTISGAGMDTTFTLTDVSVSVLDQNGTFDLMVEIIDDSGKSTTLKYHQLPNTIFLGVSRAFVKAAKPEIAPFSRIIFAANGNGSFYFKPVPFALISVIKGATVKFNN